MMMRRIKLLLPFLIFFSLACGLFAPVSPPTPTLAPAMLTSAAETESVISTQAALALLFSPTPDILATQTEAAAQTATAVANYTATPIPTLTPEISPDDLIEEEKPVPPPAQSPGGSYRLENEVLIGAYGIRYWRHTDSETGFEDVILIEKTGMESIKIEQAVEIAHLTNTDINGDGYPEVIAESYSGGAHCCFSTHVYSLRETPTLILKTPESNASGQFKDLDEDGIYEFITADDIFAYQYCPFVSSPFVKVIMSYDAEKESYLPNSPNFPQEYAEDILRDTKNAERVSKAETYENGEWDETSKCSILHLSLDYIYLGDLATARSELERLYIYNDIDDFWNEVIFILQDSLLYVKKEIEEK
ncbi:MAG: VCBS repeat-containing protein [Anaerolineae bacterium]|jgi:hypothetical protein|nr:VCBS repeat-containing protein [Anaerolineae bacterium]MBT7189860.1 VCBS repeat-containing protein [Anaerolineae bacterium]MBT7991365.1 VCBS repeat-containing protein [Anaerolineae bacterium]